MRIVIRRPHAYWFLDDVTAARGGVVGATPAGIELGDGSAVPLPGLFVFDTEGALLGSVGLTAPGALAEVTRLLAGAM